MSIQTIPGVENEEQAKTSQAHDDQIELRCALHAMIPRYCFSLYTILEQIGG